MGLNNIDRDTLVDIYWERCKNTLSDADSAISLRRWNMAANRIYYSVFYAVSALFVKDGHPIKSHRGAKAVFSQHYILTGKVEREWLTYFSQLETLRDKADYNVIFQATEEETTANRQKLKQFIAIIKKLIDETE